MTNYAYWGICALGRARPQLIPRLNRLCSSLSGSRRVRDRSYRVFRTPRRVPITEMEYAIPRDRAAAAVRAVREIAESERVRRAGADRGPLRRRRRRVPEPGERSRLLLHRRPPVPAESTGRTTSARSRSCSSASAAGRTGASGTRRRPRRCSAMYPDWERFAAVRRRLDPDGLFANAYVDRVLGAAGMTATRDGTAAPPRRAGARRDPPPPAALRSSHAGPRARRR